MLSMALPGLGHHYLRRRALASIELALGLAVFLAAVYDLGRTFARVVWEQAPLIDLLRVCLPWAFALAGYSIADGVFTWIVSRRRIVTIEGDSSR